MLCQEQPGRKPCDGKTGQPHQKGKQRRVCEIELFRHAVLGGPHSDRIDFRADNGHDRINALDAVAPGACETWRQVRQCFPGLQSWQHVIICRRASRTGQNPFIPLYRQKGSIECVIVIRRQPGVRHRDTGEPHQLSGLISHRMGCIDDRCPRGRGFFVDQHRWNRVGNLRRKIGGHTETEWGGRAGTFHIARQVVIACKRKR